MKDQAVSMRVFGVFCIICLSVATMPVFARAEADKETDRGRLKIVGGIMYLLLLPYMILVLNNDLFRQRFYGCFRLKGMLAPAVAESQDQIYP